jgi:enoyl-CoA hydratase/carnithine racemase
MTGAGSVDLTINGSVAEIVFNRPHMRNALSLDMYDALSVACARIAATPAVRVTVFRGAGGAFVAGTDIAEFRAFLTGADGVAYEARIERGIAEIEALPVPTLAVVDGPAMGGGLMIATACDLRLASTGAQFGAPIARTVGNCLSSANLSRLERAFGLGRTRRMLLVAEPLDAAEALACGFLTAVAEPEALDSRCADIVARLLGNAPMSMAATRELLRTGGGSDEAVIARIYGSRDFKEGVEAFLAKRRPEWTGS